MLKTKSINPKIIKIIIFTLISIAFVRMIFSGGNVDEEYAIVLAYRISKGESLLFQLWEPHQTSALFLAPFISLFHFFTKGVTGLALFCHIIGSICQILVGFFLGYVIRKITPMYARYSWLITCIYVLCFPKGVLTPEYTNLQNYFTTLIALFIILETNTDNIKKKYFLCVIVGTLLLCDIFAYPSMIILYPIVILYQFVDSFKSNKLEVLIKSICITLPCALFGGLFLLIISSHRPFTDLLANLKFVLSDGSHSKNLLERTPDLLYEGAVLFVQLIACLAIATIITVILCRLKKEEKNWFISFLPWNFLIVCVIFQLYSWFFTDVYINQPATMIVGFFILGLFTSRHNPYYPLVICTAFGFIGVVLLSNFKLYELIYYLVPGAISGVLSTIPEPMPANDNDQITEKPNISTFLIIWIVALSIGRIWVGTEANDVHSSLTEIHGIQKSGPGFGLLTSYMPSYSYNLIANELKELINEDDSVLYVGTRSFYYMLMDANIAAPNTISTPTYDSSILEYWKQNPEKYPTVIMIEWMWGNDPYITENSFLYDWIHTQFPYTVVKDYEYFQFYRR